MERGQLCNEECQNTIIQVLRKKANFKSKSIEQTKKQKGSTVESGMVLLGHDFGPPQPRSINLSSKEACPLYYNQQVQWLCEVPSPS